jgi:hypothetical protein
LSKSTLDRDEPLLNKHDRAVRCNEQFVGFAGACRVKLAP